MKKLSLKQANHLAILNAQNRAKKANELKRVLDYDISFFRFKNGNINISKLSRCSGLSRNYIAKKLWQWGLI